MRFAADIPIDSIAGQRLQSTENEPGPALPETSDRQLTRLRKCQLGAMPGWNR